MSNEPELEQWRTVWTSAAPGEMSQVRRYRRGYIANLLFAALLIVFAALVLLANSRPEVFAWAVVVWLTTIGATAFYIWNWRELWRSAGQSVQDYASACEHRCRAALRAVRFGYLFLALQVTIAVPWLTYDFVQGEISPARYAIKIVCVAVLIAAFIAWFGRSRRRALDELARISEFLR